MVHVVPIPTFARRSLPVGFEHDVHHFLDELLPLELVRQPLELTVEQVVLGPSKDVGQIVSKLAVKVALVEPHEGRDCRIFQTLNEIAITAHTVNGNKQFFPNVIR